MSNGDMELEDHCCMVKDLAIWAINIESSRPAVQSISYGADHPHAPTPSHPHAPHLPPPHSECGGPLVNPLALLHRSSHRRRPPRRCPPSLPLLLAVEEERRGVGLSARPGERLRSGRVGLAGQHRILLRRRIRATAMAGEGSCGAASCCLARRSRRRHHARSSSPRPCALWGPIAPAMATLQCGRRGRGAVRRMRTGGGRTRARRGQWPPGAHVLSSARGASRSTGTTRDPRSPSSQQPRWPPRPRPSGPTTPCTPTCCVHTCCCCTQSSSSQFTFADTFRGRYDDSLLNAKMFYPSDSGSRTNCSGCGVAVRGDLPDLASRIDYWPIYP